jgi:nitroreductase
MTFEELALKRQSTRAFSPEAVPREQIERCINAARLAPSACNSQPWKFIIVDDADLCRKVATETFSSIAPFNKFTLQAPVMAVQVMEKATMLSQIGGRIRNRDYSLIDTGIAAEHFCLQAAELGIGSCMIGWFNERNLKKILGIPSGRSIGLLIALGYPADKAREKKRKNIDQISNYNSYE